MKLYKDGSILVSAIAITTNLEIPDYAYRPFTDLDSNNNLHVVYTDDSSTDATEIYYTMINTNDGSPIIDDTLITSDDDYRSTRPMIGVDYLDKVHVIWHDKRLSSEAEIFYKKIDPGLDDQDGDAASLPGITLIDDTPLTSDDGIKSRRPMMTMDLLRRRIHMTWLDSKTGPNEYGQPYYMQLDLEGNKVMDEVLLHSNADLEWDTREGAWIYVDSNCRAHITWGDKYGEGDDLDTWYVSVYQAPVGGKLLPVDKSELVAPYSPMYTWIGLVSVIISTVAVSIVYVEHRKRKQT